MNVGSKVIYGLQTPKMFVNFHNSISYFIHLSTFSEKGFVEFTKPSEGSMALKKLKNPFSNLWLNEDFNCD